MKIFCAVMVVGILGAKRLCAETTTAPATQAATQAVVTETLKPDGDGTWTLWLGMTLEEARKVAIASAHAGVVKSTDDYKPKLTSDDGTRQTYDCEVWNGGEKSVYSLTVEGGKVVRLRRPAEN